MMQPVFKATRRGGGRVVTPKRIEALSRQMAGAVKVDLKKGIEAFRAKVDPAEMLAAYKQGSYAAVRRTVKWDSLGDTVEKGLRKLEPAYEAGAKNAKAMVPGGLRFDMRNQDIGRYLQRRTGELITTSEQGMLEAVRAATERSFTAAATPQDVADMIRGSIGLNAPQARALFNYSKSLRQSDVDPDRHDEMVDAYRDRLLDQRATMIGRTEVRFAQNAGQRAVWDEAQEEGFLPPGSGRQWVVDGNPCPELCRPMDGVVVPMDGMYTLPDGREVDNPTSSHPNCLLPGQRVHTRDRGLVAIEEVRVGDSVMTHRRRFRPVVDVFHAPHSGPVVTLEAGRHFLSATHDHPIRVEDGWVNAGELRAADGIVTLAANSTGMQRTLVTRPTHWTYQGRVHNITVEDDHSYVAEGIVTHNCYCIERLVFGRG